MDGNCNERRAGVLPEAFCWTKFGHEAGESSLSIFCRKERERQLNGGVFLWGIGQSVMPSLLELLSVTRVPEVLFSPIRTPGASRDVSPEVTFLWTQAFAYDGSAYALPRYSIVTSRASSRNSHYALVCESASPIDVQLIGQPAIEVRRLRNLLSGSSVGSSQVTSVVRSDLQDGSSSPSYAVAARARLVYPYMVYLVDRVRIPSGLMLGDAAGSDAGRVVEGLLSLRHEAAAGADGGSGRSGRSWIQEMLPAEYGFTGRA
jgi:hypothetical protein